ncbi:NUDIX domain-containing protein [Nocardioides sp.]|uniref:NUDIX domain-containing protein n=1 Tax=Nocardioides sp. TaxID=35761 RepID=UPI0035274BCE
MANLPQRQRVAAYAVVMRTAADGTARVLLSRLAPKVSTDELWTLPGGGIDHGEHPRDALVREVKEETGLDALVGDTAHVYSAHVPTLWREGTRLDYQALRLVFEAWVATDAPEPRVLEVNGSTMDAAWVPVAEVLDGTVPVTSLVTEAMADHEPFRLQRLAAYAVIRRGGDVLLTRISSRGHHAGSWTLPGGGVDHGESPTVALEREVLEECGLECEVGGLLGVHDVHFAGTAPSGRHEDFHGIHLLFAATVADGAEPHAAEVDGTTDAAAWVRVADIEAGRVDVLDVVHAALAQGA